MKFSSNRSEYLGDAVDKNSPNYLIELVELAIDYIFLCKNGVERNSYFEKNTSIDGIGLSQNLIVLISPNSPIGIINGRAIQAKEAFNFIRRNNRIYIEGKLGLINEALEIAENQIMVPSYEEKESDLACLSYQCTNGHHLRILKNNILNIS